MWIPPSARSTIEEDRAELAQQVFEAEQEKLEYFDKELRAIDEHLRLVLAKPNAEHDALKPGYFHVIRLNPGHPASVTPFEHDDGTWRDLDSSLFDFIADSDLWNDRATKARQERNRKLEEARKRQSDREALDRAGEFDARWKAANSTQISVPRSI